MAYPGVSTLPGASTFPGVGSDTPLVFAGTPVGTQGTTASTPITVSPHADTAVGDRMFLYISSSDDAAPTYTATGWTALVTAQGGTGTLKTWLFTKVRAGGETSYTVTRVNATDTITQITTVKGHDAGVSLVQGSVGTRAASGGGTTTVAPSITPTNDGVVLVFAADRTSAITTPMTVNNGFTPLLSSEISAQSLYVAGKAAVAGVATGATTVTYALGHATNGQALQVAVAAAPVAYTGTSTLTGTGTITATGMIGAVGEWSFDEGSGTTAADVSGNSRTLTINSAKWTGSGHTNASLNGDRAFVNQNLLGTYPTSGTVMGWVYFNAAGDDAWVILGASSNTHQYHSLFVRDDGGGTFRFYGYMGDGEIGGLTGGSPLTSWHHFALAWSGTNRRMYWDGTEVFNGTDTGGLNFLTAATMGASFSGSANHLTNLRLDDLRTYNVALTATQINALKSTPVPAGGVTNYNGSSTLTGTGSITATASSWLGPVRPVFEYAFNEGVGEDSANTGTHPTGDVHSGDGTYSPIWEPGHVGYGTDVAYSSGAWEFIDSTPTSVKQYPRFTMMGWVYPKLYPGSDSGNWVITLSPFGYFQVQTYGDGQLNLAYRNTIGDESFINLSNTMPWDTWSFVAASFDYTTGNVKFYINGTLVDSRTVSDQLLPPGSPIVDNLVTLYGGYTSTMDDVRIFDAVLSDAEVVSWMGLPAGDLRESTATLTGTGAITATGAVGKLSSSSLTGTGSITATGVVGKNSTSTLTGTGSITTAGVVAKTSTSTLTGTGSITASGVVAKTSIATLTGTGTITATGNVGVESTSTLTGVGSITATGNVVSGVSSTSTLSGTGTITATGVVGKLTTSSLVGTGTITATGVVARFSTTTLSGTGLITTTGVVGINSTSTLSGVGSITASGISATGPSSTLIGTGSITATGVVGKTADSTLTGTGSITTSAVVAKFTTTTLTASGTITSTGVLGKSGTSTLTGTGTITATGVVTSGASASVTGTGTITATGVVGVRSTSTLVGTGSVSTTRTLGLFSTAILVATGTITATGEIPPDGGFPPIPDIRVLTAYSRTLEVSGSNTRTLRAFDGRKLTTSSSKTMKNITSTRTLKEST